MTLAQVPAADLLEILRVLAFVLGVLTGLLVTGDF